MTRAWDGWPLSCISLPMCCQSKFHCTENLSVAFCKIKTKTAAFGHYLMTASQLSSFSCHLQQLLHKTNKKIRKRYLYQFLLWWHSPLISSYVHTWFNGTVSFSVREGEGNRRPVNLFHCLSDSIHSCKMVLKYVDSKTGWQGRNAGKGHRSPLLA